MTGSPAARRCVLLLSGGLDSSTCLLVARAEGFEVHALSFEYGQRHAAEVEAARRVAERYGAREHRIVRIELPEPRASALTDPGAAVPRGGTPGEGPIPPTYVPARNTLFLSHAASWGEAVAAGDLFIGANVLDYSGYPDCRPEFLEAFERALNLGTKAAVEGGRSFRIRAPLLSLTKADIVRLGAALGLDFALTSSCYDPDPSGGPCGDCDSCRLREKGFREAGASDPLRAR
jgi:7-cyano-7-deazaguanine synthase